MSLEGIEEVVAGLGFIKDKGVRGGSILGTTFFHASSKAASLGAVASRSVANRRAPDRLRRRVVANRNMVEEIGKVGFAWLLLGRIQITGVCIGGAEMGVREGLFCYIGLGDE